MKLDRYIETTDKIQVNEFIEGGVVMSIIFATIMIVKFLLRLRVFLRIIKTANMGSGRYDEYYSKKLEEIVKEPCNVSKYFSSTPNACAYPAGKMYYSTGLQVLLTEPELIAVLLHEYGHVKEQHTKKRFIKAEGSALALELCFAALAAIPYVWPIMLLFSYYFPSELSELIAKKSVYKAELEADSYAKKFGYGKELATSLAKIESWMKNMIQQTWKDATPKQVQTAIDTIQKNGGYPTFKKRIDIILNSAIVKNIAERGKFSAINTIDRIVKSSKLFSKEAEQS